MAARYHREPQTLGQLAEARRLELGYSQVQMAEYLGGDQGSYSLFARDQLKRPFVFLRGLICRFPGDLQTIRQILCGQQTLGEGDSEPTEGAA